MLKIVFAMPLTVMLVACERNGPPSPQPAELPGDKWAVFTVESYRSLPPTSIYNPHSRQNGVWQDFEIVLESDDGIRMTLSCGQLIEADIPEGCAQGARPNERVWTRAGVRGDALWIYTNSKPQKATFWQITSSERN